MCNSWKKHTSPFLQTDYNHHITIINCRHGQCTPFRGHLSTNGEIYTVFRDTQKKIKKYAFILHDFSATQGRAWDEANCSKINLSDDEVVFCQNISYKKGSQAGRMLLSQCIIFFGCRSILYLPNCRLYPNANCYTVGAITGGGCNIFDIARVVDPSDWSRAYAKQSLYWALWLTSFTDKEISCDEPVLTTDRHLDVTECVREP